MLKLVVTVFVLMILGPAASAQSCVRTDATCVRSGNPSVGGVRLEEACLKIDLEELCEREEPLNECVPFNRARVIHDETLLDGQCRRTSRECTRYRHGECDRWLLNYTCWNGPLDHSPAELLDRIFHNFDEATVNDCGPLEASPNCKRGNDAITEDYGTRNINGLDVTRAWWRRDREYDCTDPLLEETCRPFAGNPVCTQTDHKLCVVSAPDGTCIQMEYVYDCAVDPTFEANCAAINVCAGNNCTGVAQDPSQDFPKAAAWLNVLDSLADDFGCSKDGDVVDPVSGEVDLAACPLDPALFGAFDPSLFEGTKMVCNRGFINCCDGDGEGSCSQESEDLALHREALVTHFLEGECTSLLAGSCLSVREHHCVYKSRFARVFQEQAHLQTGIQFGGIWSADPCPGLDIYQLELLDVEAMDFSEVFGDILGGVNTPVESEVTDRLTGGVLNLAPEVNDVFDK